MKTESKPSVIYLKDYTPPSYLIDKVELYFDIREGSTLVSSKLSVFKNPSAQGGDLFLHGEELSLISIKMDGQALPSGRYSLSPAGLTLTNPPERFTLEIQNELHPEKNKALEGLYISDGIYCTQNEPNGFRRITYFVDRPDNMARYTTTLTADKDRYPVLLSNGNPADWGDLPEGRHFMTWNDPFPKPSYLFALVAGDLAAVENEYTTNSGRKITLKIYVDKGNEYKCDFAMESLKQAMKWDEETFGLECDLDLYNIVAVDAFNFGAMENKGLNIFNSQYVLADPKTATDQNYLGIQNVVGHEYFHNWTGNRVTCRDWFQITLKEGLTVFRDQEFSGDMTSRAVKRISDVRLIRDYQFVEDAGPNSHPIRPASYIEVNNFYTTTVYNKGAEVIRMIETLIGKDTFRKGITKYFELYDGQAVTTDDFIHAMELVSRKEFSQFKNWYDQAGTPVCRVTGTFDPERSTYRLDIVQKAPEILPSKTAKPFYFPFKVALLGKEGAEISLRLEGEPQSSQETTRILVISKEKQSFVFTDVKDRPVPSLLRDFSAPVKLEYDYSSDDLMFLLAHDSNLFNRFDAAVRMAGHSLKHLIGEFQEKRPMTVNPEFIRAFGNLLQSRFEDPAFTAEAIVLPSVTALTEEMKICDFEAAFIAKEFLYKTLAKAHRKVLEETYTDFHQTEIYSVDSESVGKRALKNIALGYLMYLEEPQVLSLVLTQFHEARNMTDEISSLDILTQSAFPERDGVLAEFYKRWKADALVMNKWFAVQAVSKQPDTLSRIERLESDPAFDRKNPNKVRSLYGAFSQNLIRFHDASGSGYRFMADKILEVDRFNPSVAAKLSGAFKKFSKLDAVRKKKMGCELERILASGELSRDVYEIISKTFDSAKENV